MGCVAISDRHPSLLRVRSGPVNRLRAVRGLASRDRSMDDGCKAMPQDQNGSLEQGEFRAQEFSAQAFSSDKFSDPLLSLSHVWSSGWMTQVSRLNAFIAEQSDLGKKLRDERSNSWDLQFLRNVGASAGLVIVGAGFLAASYLGALAILQASAEAGADLQKILAQFEKWLGADVTVYFLTTLIAAGLLLVAEVLGVRVKLDTSSKKKRGKPERFSDRLQGKIRAKHFHFGHLQVGYQMSSDGKLIVRSLGDEFVAVFSSQMIKGIEIPECKHQFSDDALGPWFGEQLTSPLVLKILGSGSNEDHTSDLIIHGMHFELPGEAKRSGHTERPDWSTRATHINPIRESERDDDHVDYRNFSRTERYLDELEKIFKQNRKTDYYVARPKRCSRSREASRKKS